MTDAAVLGAFAFMVLCLLIVAVCGLLVGWLRENAYQREQEARYADEWVRAHKHRHDDRGRYLTDEEGRPE